MITPLFSLGRQVVTSGISKLMAENVEFDNFVKVSIIRHSIGDWGELDPEDWEHNNKALASGEERLFSAYDRVQKIWVITEWDKSVTTVLLPEEY